LPGFYWRCGAGPGGGGHRNLALNANGECRRAVVALKTAERRKDGRRATGAGREEGGGRGRGRARLPAFPRATQPIFNARNKAL
jgi:hypothetical protein